jgi:DNA invertase Pin-like site-specific DNA recombinase
MPRGPKGAKRAADVNARAVMFARIARGDTTTPHGRLMLTVLGGWAEFERVFQNARRWCSDGLRRREGWI